MHCRWQLLERAARDGILCFIRGSRPLKTSANTQKKSDNANDDQADRPLAKHKRPSKPIVPATDIPSKPSSTSTSRNMLCCMSIGQSQDNQSIYINMSAALRSFFERGLSCMEDDEDILALINRMWMEDVGSASTGAEWNSSQSGVSVIQCLQQCRYSGDLAAHPPSSTPALPRVLLKHATERAR